jgi:RimJ/RimL family protein N-acetyltransferase
MNTPSLSGKLIRLAVMNTEEDLEQWAGWFRNSEYQRLLDTGPAELYTPAQIKEWLEKDLGTYTLFGIRTLNDDRLIGFVDLAGFEWSARTAWTSIGIGQPEYWGKGYGTEAMSLLADYAFETVNLNRVNLSVFGYNERAYHSYLKCGFKEEGRVRQLLLRNNQRWDMIFMGLLREEWKSIG